MFFIINFIKNIFFKLRMRTHYDVLKLDKNCSAKEIRDSFLKLSKIYHPDVNKQADAHSKFVEVNEAYSVLGKTEARLVYDESLCAQSRMEYRIYNASTHMRTYADYAHMYTKERNYNPGATYFTRSKLQALCFCCVLIFMGTAMQLKAMNNRRYFHSHRIAASLKERNNKINKEMFEKVINSPKQT